MQKGVRWLAKEGGRRFLICLYQSLCLVLSTILFIYQSSLSAYIYQTRCIIPREKGFGLGKDSRLKMFSYTPLVFTWPPSNMFRIPQYAI